MDNMDAALARIRKNSPEKVANASRLLNVLLGNIAKHPYEHKFRRIKYANLTLRAKLWNADGVHDLLTCAGFLENQEQTCMYLPMEAELRELRRALLGVHRIHTEKEPGKKKAKKVKASAKVKQDRARLLTEREMILKQFKSDQREKKDERDARACATAASVAKPLKFGGNLNTFKSVGVDLNKKGG